MAQAEDYQVADAVAATITAASLSITPLNVTRVYVPNISSAALPDGVNVYVMPQGIEVVRATKDKWDYVITVHVAIVRRKQEGTNAEIDPLRDYSEEVFRELRDKTYGSGDTPDNIDVWFRSRTNIDVTYDPEQLDENELFVSLLALEWGARI